MGLVFPHPSLQLLLALVEIVSLERGGCLVFPEALYLDLFNERVSCALFKHNVE